MATPIEFDYELGQTRTFITDKMPVTMGRTLYQAWMDGLVVLFVRTIPEKPGAWNISFPTIDKFTKNFGIKVVEKEDGQRRIRTNTKPNARLAAKMILRAPSDDSPKKFVFTDVFGAEVSVDDFIKLTPNAAQVMLSVTYPEVVSVPKGSYA